MHAYIGLGANLGDRRETLRAATDELGRLGRLLRRSRIYETAALGLDGRPADQPPYLNAALLLDADLSPQRMLADLLAIEKAHGRVRDPMQRYAPRTLDLDLLLLGEAGELRVEQPDLQVPHPRLH